LKLGNFFIISPPITVIDNDDNLKSLTSSNLEVSINNPLDNLTKDSNEENITDIVQKLNIAEEKKAKNEGL